MLLPVQAHFSRYGFVVLAPGESPTAAVTTFPEAWHERYFAHEFSRIDPVFHFASRHTRVSASTLLSPAEMSSPLFEEARAYGADSNFVSVSNLGGSRMVFGGVNHHLDRRSAQEAELACKATHRQIMVARLSGLSDAQIDILEMYEEGLLDKEVAGELNVSISAVAQRKQAICHHLGVNSFRVVMGVYSVAKWGSIVPNLASEMGIHKRI